MFKVLTLRQALLAAGMALTLPVMAQSIEVAGSSSVQKAIIEPVTAKAKEAGIDIKYLSVGSVKGLQMLIDGKVTAAAISELLEDSSAAARKAGSTIPANLKLTTVLTEKLVPIVHPENTVTALSKEQLQGLFSGKIANWKEVGGPDQAVSVVVPAASSGTRGVLDKSLMAGLKITGTAREMRTSAAEVADVARDKGGIGYVGSGTAEASKGKIKEISGPDVSRPLGFVTIGEPSADVKKMLDFLQKPDTKKLFAQ